MATQMKLKVLFGGKSHGRPDNNKVVSFSALFFVFTLTWITEEELERVIEKKGDEFRQPRPQGFSLKKWVGREKALASAGHVSPRTP